MCDDPRVRAAMLAEWRAERQARKARLGGAPTGLPAGWRLYAGAASLAGLVLFVTVILL